MGGRQAAEVLGSVKQGNLEDVDKFKKEIIQRYEDEASAYFGTARLWDDGIIDPVDTRKAIALGLSIAANKEVPDYKPGVYRM